MFLKITAQKNIIASIKPGLSQYVVFNIKEPNVSECIPKVHITPKHYKNSTRMASVLRSSSKFYDRLDTCLQLENESEF
jgi:hypothetical protein